MDGDARDAPAGGAHDAPPGSSPDAGPVTGFPAGVNIRIRPRVVRLPGDGRDDLVLARSDTSSGTGASHGLYVLHGRASGFLGGYDQFLSTAPADPVATEVADVLGGPEPDLVVLGRPDNADGRLYVFEGLPGGGFAPPLLRVVAGYRPRGGSATDPEPIFITTARVAGRVKADLVFGDLYSVFHVAPTAWTQAAFELAPLVELPRPGGDPWEAVNGVLAMPSAVAGRDDLFLVQNSTAHWFFHAAAFDGYETTKISTWPLPETGRRSFNFADVDANGIADLATIFVQTMTFMVVERHEAADPTTMIRGFETTFDFIDSAAEDWIIAQLDDDPRPDLVVLDEFAAGSTFGLHIWGNLHDDGAGAIAGVPRNAPAIIVPPGHPTRVVAGDFDGDGETELRLFSTDLDETYCYVPRSDGAGGMFTFNVCP